MVREARTRSSQEDAGVFLHSTDAAAAALVAEGAIDSFGGVFVFWGFLLYASVSGQPALQQLPGQESKEGRLLFTPRETGNSVGAQADAVPETISTRSVVTLWSSSAFWLEWLRWDIWSGRCARAGPRRICPARLARTAANPAAPFFAPTGRQPYWYFVLSFLPCASLRFRACWF